MSDLDKSEAIGLIRRTADVGGDVVVFPDEGRVIGALSELDRPGRRGGEAGEGEQEGQDVCRCGPKASAEPVRSEVHLYRPAASVSGWVLSRPDAGDRIGE